MRRGGTWIQRWRVPLGFLSAGLFVVLARPRPLTLIIGAGISLVGLIFRAWAAGHIRKNDALAVSGPYAYTRNPLYLGSFIIALGFAVASRSLWIAAVMVVMLLAIYLPVILSEEDFLRQRFNEFEDYARNVPRLFPKLRGGRHNVAFSWDLYLKHREYNALLGTLGMMAALAVKLLFADRY